MPTGDVSPCPGTTSIGVGHGNIISICVCKKVGTFGHCMVQILAPTHPVAVRLREKDDPGCGQGGHVASKQNKLDKDYSATHTCTHWPWDNTYAHTTVVNGSWVHADFPGKGIKHTQVSVTYGRKTIYPVRWTEVNGFGEIVTLVESGMVRTRKGHHEFASMLVCADDLRQKCNHIKEHAKNQSDSW